MYCKRFCVVAVAALVFAVTTQSGVGWAAGNVTAELVDRTLYIVGDKEGNDLFIRGNLENGTLAIEGDLVDSFPLGDVEAVWINTGGGEDLISLHGTIDGDVVISSGSDRDSISVRGEIFGDLSIESGHGPDHIGVRSLILAGSLDISTGHAVDAVEFYNNITIGGDLCINTGVNTDFVNFNSSPYHVDVAGDLLLHLGQGDDWLFVSTSSLYYCPAINVGGSAGLHGDQGFNDQILWSPFIPLEDLIVAGEGVDIDGFE